MTSGMAEKMFAFLLLILFSCNSYIYCVQVCDDYQYYVKPDEQHCRNNPDGEKNLTQLLRDHPGITAEEYNIFTEDGYQILIVRGYSTTDKDPIVLGHSSLITSLAFANRGNKSIAHRLIGEGFDVWIVNFRGCPYSRGHKTLKATDEKYWQFSIQELGEYDLTSTLELVMKETGKKAIYIGHGSGTTAGYIYGSLKVEAAESTLKGMISLSPLAFADGTKSYTVYFLTLVNYLKPLINQRLHGEVPIDVGQFNCSSLFDYYLNEVFRVPAYGDDFGQIDPVYLPLVRSQNKQKSVGINIMIQFYQIIKTKKFQALDCGTDMNMKKYGQDTPPEYNISQIPVPVSLFVGNNDWIGSKENAKRFYTKLNPDAQCGINVIMCDKWNHNDFLEAKDIEELLFVPLLGVIDGISEGVCKNEG